MTPAQDGRGRTAGPLALPLAFTERVCVHDANGNLIAIVYSGKKQGGFDAVETNARFIVEAVNNHAAMLDALREIADKADIAIMDDRPASCGLPANTLALKLSLIHELAERALSTLTPQAETRL